MCATLAVTNTHVHAQLQTAGPPGPALPTPAHPLGQPLVAADAKLRADKVTRWRDGDANYLLLEGDVSTQVGVYGFRARRAMVRIKQVSTGPAIHDLAFFLEGVQPGDAPGAVAAEADQLLVTVSTRGEIHLSTNLLESADGPPANDPLVQRGTNRINRYLASFDRPLRGVPDGLVLFDDATLERKLAAQGLPTPKDLDAGVEAGTKTPQPEADTDTPSETRLAGEAQPQPQPQPQPSATPTPGIPFGPDSALPATGVVSFHVKQPVFQEHETGQVTAALMGEVTVVYEDPTTRRSLTLRAENAVLFLDLSLDNAMGQTQFDASVVRGVYLEENVMITDGQYTLRAPRVFYDLATDKAVVLDAVFYTWDAQRQIPIYVRAEKLRQEARRSWSATNAKITTSEFAEPHFAIAAAQVNIQMEDRPDGSVNTQFQAKDITASALDLPFFYFPQLSGEGHESPIRSASGGFGSDGPTVQTNWDLYSLAGKAKPNDIDLTGQLDYLGERGPAIGVDLEYDRPTMFGEFDSYFLMYDQGEDSIGDRNDIGFDGDPRGFFVGRHRQALPLEWELSLELGLVSDETFLEEFFPDQSDESKDFEASFYLKKQEPDWALTFLTSARVNDFVAQTATLQTYGYTVDKLPELGYYRTGTSLFDDRATYYTENTLGYLDLRPSKDSPADRGFTNAQSMAVFGIPSRRTTFEDRAAMMGLPTDGRARLDSRHEFQVPLEASIIDIVPYVTGRFTGYDEDFDDFARDSDNVRLWGGGGVRLATSFANTFDQIENDILDLHRVRHIIEPYANLFLYGSSEDPENFPVFDADIEGIAEGGGAQVGIRQTFQTQRGGPGRWRSVDFLTMNHYYVERSDDADIRNQLPRFFSYRPEYSTGGDQFYSDLAWLVSDTLAVVADYTYAFERSQVATWHAGMSLAHTDRLELFVDYTEIEAISTRLLSWGFNYELTRKYLVGFQQTIDLEESEFRSVEVAVTRKLPRWNLIVEVSHDDIDEEQSVFVIAVPQGFDWRRFGRRAVGVLTAQD